MSNTPDYLTRGIIRALAAELDTIPSILDIAELDQAERRESWPDPIDAPARAWTVTLESGQRLVCLDREQFLVIE
jgi:hypothetical protein